MMHKILTTNEQWLISTALRTWSEEVAKTLVPGGYMDPVLPDKAIKLAEAFEEADTITLEGE